MRRRSSKAVQHCILTLLNYAGLLLLKHPQPCATLNEPGAAARLARVLVKLHTTATERLKNASTRCIANGAESCPPALPDTQSQAPLLRNQALPRDSHTSLMTRLYTASDQGTSATAAALATSAFFMLSRPCAQAQRAAHGCFCGLLSSQRDSCRARHVRLLYALPALRSGAQGCSRSVTSGYRTTA